MSAQSDYAILDQKEILQFVFYPRQDYSAPPPNAVDHKIPIENGVVISCRFHLCSDTSPSVIYFHGNGEVVSDYDYIAPAYNRLGINLFVVDYRGYGASSGVPTFTSLVTDAHVVFKAFKGILRQGRFTGAAFTMGRSLGSIAAVELALHYGAEMKGLIIESGMASMSTLMAHMGLSGQAFRLTPGFPNLTKIREVRLPTLILHGEYDSLIPATEGQALYDESASQNKRLVIIPGAEHNDIMMVGGEAYFGEISRFVHA